MAPRFACKRQRIQRRRVSFVSLLENVEVEPATPPAQVIVNSRTGTIIINGNVRVTPAAITHGSLTVRVTEDPNVQTQTNVVANDAGVVATPAAPVVTPDSAVGAEEKLAKAFVFDPGIQLTDIVDAINAVGATPSDLGGHIGSVEGFRRAARAVDYYLGNTMVMKSEHLFRTAPGQSLRRLSALIAERLWKRSRNNLKRFLSMN